MNEKSFLTLDKDSKKILKKIYKAFDKNEDISVSSPEYEKIQIDMLIENKLLKHIDVTTLSGWVYIIQPTYYGKEYFNANKKHNKEKCIRWTIEIIKFLIPTIISIIALLLSLSK